MAGDGSGVAGTQFGDAEGACDDRGDRLPPRAAPPGQGRSVVRRATQA